MTNKVLVIGGGIAGPVAALALERIGLEPVIHEAQPSGSDGVGAFLTLAENGIAALACLGLDSAVRGLGMPTDRMTMANAGGRRLGELPYPGRTVMRGELYALLRDEAVRRGIAVEYGARLTDVTRTVHGVRAVFADGRTTEGDLLVGADGLRSRVRSLLDPRAPSARHVVLLNTGGVVPADRVPAEVPRDEPGAAHFVFGARCFFGWFLHPDGDVWWFANPPQRREAARGELEAVAPDEWRRRLLELFAGDAGPVLPLVRATERVLPAWATYDVPRVRRWHDDRVVLVGDAVHATSPSSGQGASLAIEDGVELSRCLRDLREPAQAFAAFTALRRPRVEAVVKQGRRNGSGKAPGPLGARVRDAVLPYALRRFATPEALAWMTDFRIDVDAPVATDPAVRSVIAAGRGPVA